MPALYEALIENMSDQVTYTPAAGEPVTLTVIVNDPRDELDEADPSVMRFKGRETDFGRTPASGERITYGGKVYRIRGVRRNQYGWIKLSGTRVD